MKINLDELSEAELIEPQTGILTRFNRKSVTVITDNGGHCPVVDSVGERETGFVSTEVVEMKSENRRAGSIR